MRPDIEQQLKEATEHALCNYAVEEERTAQIFADILQATQNFSMRPGARKPNLFDWRRMAELADLRPATPQMIQRVLGILLEREQIALAKEWVARGGRVAC